MIISNFATILGKKKMKISKVIEETKISRPTLTALYYNTGKGINFDTLNSLCNYLQVEPADILKFYAIDVSKVTIELADVLISDDFVNSRGEVENMLSNVEFNGKIEFVQKNISSITFSGNVARVSYDKFELFLDWNCTREYYKNIMLNEDVEYVIQDKIQSSILAEIPTNDNPSIDTVQNLFTDCGYYISYDTLK